MDILGPPYPIPRTARTPPKCTSSPPPNASPAPFLKQSHTTPKSGWPSGRSTHLCGPGWCLNFLDFFGHQPIVLRGNSWQARGGWGGHYGISEIEHLDQLTARHVALLTVLSLALEGLYRWHSTSVSPSASGIIMAPPSRSCVLRSAPSFSHHVTVAATQGPQVGVL